MFRGISRIAATTLIRHAKDFDVATLSEMIRSMHESGEPHESFVVFIILATGLRFADLSEMRFGWMDWAGKARKEHVSLEIHLAKNIKSPNKLRQLCIPMAWIPAMPFAWKEDFEKWLESPVDKVVTHGLSLDDINVAIKCSSNSGGGTSYSFRRNFIHRIIQQHSKRRGPPNYEECLKFPLHHNMLRAVYDRKFSDKRSNAPAESDGDDEEDEED